MPRFAFQKTRRLAGLLDLDALCHGFQKAVVVHFANAARHRAVLAQRVAQRETHQRIGGGIGFDAAQKIRQHLIGLPAIEIIRIDHAERLPDGVFAHQHRVRRAPRFLALRRDLEARRQLRRHVLEDVVNRHPTLDVRFDLGAERLLDVAPDDEHDLAEAGADRVEDGVIDDDFAGGADGVNLLESAIAAADAGRQHHESWFAAHILPIWEM